MIQYNVQRSLRLMIGLKKVTDLIIAFKLHPMRARVINVIMIPPNADVAYVDLQPFGRGHAQQQSQPHLGDLDHSDGIAHFGFFHPPAGHLAKVQ